MSSEVETIPVKTIKGEDASLADYAGKVRLVVNVASKCGLTPQYEGLEALYKQYQEQGLVVLGFPANDFAGQEPGTEEEIAQFCSLTYDVSFPMFSKVKATGTDKHPLYDALTKARPEPNNSDDAMRAKLEKVGMAVNDRPELLWNFEKFLVGKDGEVVARFSPDTTPDNPALVAAIEMALSA